MKFKSISVGGNSQGMTITAKKQVVPNQSMSLQEILERFTRGEALAIGRGTPEYHESEDDLEKLKNSDLVDRQEYLDKLKATQGNYAKQEKRKEAARLKKLEEEERAKIAAKLAAEKDPPKA